MMTVVFTSCKLVAKMFTFCDVLHETKQKTQTNFRECAIRTGNNTDAGQFWAETTKFPKITGLCQIQMRKAKRALL